MSKVRKTTCIVLGFIIGMFFVLAIIDCMNGNGLSARLNLLWCIVFLMQIRFEMLEDLVDGQNETIGKMVELLGLMCRIEVVEDEK